MPIENDIPSIAVSLGEEKENLPPHRPIRGSRSPHPYHRRKGTITDAALITRSTSFQGNKLPLITGLDRQEGHNLSRDERHRSTSPSDSGTEADDESGVVLKSLPAPPIRWRKGLRTFDGKETASPLLTPSYLDDEDKRLAVECELNLHTKLRSPSLTDEGNIKIREKFSQRRRAELLRRISETALLGFVGLVSYNSSLLVSGGIQRSDLYGYTCVVSCIYICYPLRLFYRQVLRPSNPKRTLFFIRIPAAFDPAALLYPIFIPLFVALSISPSLPGILLPNLMLSISSIPRAILPIHDDFQGYSSFQWCSTLFPLVAGQFFKCSAKGSENRAVPAGLDRESLALLFPLHQALLPTLGYLTTTSLLPAELQLFSISMINVLLLSSSPQVSILHALLWVGGIMIFILCAQVLRWVVALARVPSWRFRHPRRREGYTLLTALDDCFHKKLGKWISASTETEEMSSDESYPAKIGTRNDKRLKQPKLAVQNNIGTRSILDGSVPQSAGESGPSFPIKETEKSPSQASKRSVRRFTLPSYSAFQPPSIHVERSHTSATSLPSTKKRGHFTSLTAAQATTLKRGFAIYTYTTVVTVIAWPVRKVISTRALHGNEPVGWALGYLLGHIKAVRYFVYQNDLEDWIALPEPYDPYQVTGAGWSTLIEAQSQGAANVRLLLCAYCVGIIAAGLVLVFRLSNFVEVDTRRKVFHGMMVMMFLPATFVDPCFVALAFGLILAIFLLLDLFRASQLPPLSKPLTDFLAPYVDGRDYRGPVIVSPIFLLVGCAIPLWLSLAAVERIGRGPWDGWEVSHRELSMVSGIICVGMGDAAASLIGRRFGRRRWCWSGGKSLEGSLAFALAVVLGIVVARTWLLLGGWVGDCGDGWGLTLGKAAIAATGASLTESVLTGGNDNVIVPVVLWLLVRGLRI